MRRGKGDGSRCRIQVTHLLQKEHVRDRESTSTAETRIPCADRDKFAVVARLVEKFSREYEVIAVDGGRVLFGDGWGLVRASNTQPVLVARGEAKTPAGLVATLFVMEKPASKEPGSL